MNLHNLSYDLHPIQAEAIRNMGTNARNWFTIRLMVDNGEPIIGYYGTLSREQLRELIEVLLNWADEPAVTVETLAADIELWCAEDSESLGETTNKNRFIKSSFALSLLWTAKFYLSIANSYKRLTLAENKAWKSYQKTKSAIFPVIAGVTGWKTNSLYPTLISEVLPNCYEWFNR